MKLHHQPRYKGPGSSSEGLVNNKAKNINNCVERIAAGGDSSVAILLRASVHLSASALSPPVNRDVVDYSHELQAVQRACPELPMAHGRSLRLLTRAPAQRLRAARQMAGDYFALPSTFREPLAAEWEAKTRRKFDDDGLEIFAILDADQAITDTNDPEDQEVLQEGDAPSLMFVDAAAAGSLQALWGDLLTFLEVVKPMVICNSGRNAVVEHHLCSCLSCFQSQG